MSNNRKTTHYFNTTADAYDACMTGENFRTGDKVETGDILIIESERVIGLCDTWPVAVTPDCGKLHAVKPGFTLEGYFLDRKGFPMHQLRHAQALVYCL